MYACDPQAVSAARAPFQNFTSFILEFYKTLVQLLHFRILQWLLFCPLVPSLSLSLCQPCLSLLLPHVSALNRCTVSCASYTSLTRTRWNARSLWMQFALVQLITWNDFLVYCLLLTHTRAVRSQKATAFIVRKSSQRRNAPLRHSGDLGSSHPLAQASPRVHQPGVKNMMSGGRVVFWPTVQLAK